MAEFFQFESDFVESLRCIPMQVRFKLDTCGVKLKLHQWNKFNERDRTQLIEMPCSTASEIETYRSQLHQLIQTRTGETASDLPLDLHPDWLEGAIVPESVQTQAQELGFTIQPSHWANLTPLQRFALIKLSRSNHENKNFLPALKEFSLV
ncbi:nitrate reductase associated protein [Myxacorys almedinensis]|uniref:Nitrate reductase maturation protein NarM n=1 Tax=Myxacorys almedinensis A TaxID=2690445 RepID=A0A8J7Z6X8_9CYAN|nr:nitrate reductase associated protein [Myxacorys almedinensis]NDJ19276.1 nitrate reductase maturation protein NarM [Myxacorys almedinensis A]